MSSIQDGVMGVGRGRREDGFFRGKRGKREACGWKFLGWQANAVSLLHNAIGLGETVSKTDDPTAINFWSTVERLQDGRYQLELPLRKDRDSLEIHNNFVLARSLSQLRNSLASMQWIKRLACLNYWGSTNPWAF